VIDGSYTLLYNEKLNTLTTLIIVPVEAFAALGCYATLVGICSPTFRYRISVKQSSFFYCLTLEDGTDRLSRNVDKQLRNNGA
jgi:hypothetical protein